MVTWRPMRGAGQHDGAVPEPRSVADRHRALGHRLPRDRQVDVLVAVVLVGDVDVVAGPHVVADLDREVADDAAALADQAAIADPHHRVARQCCPGTMPADSVTSGPIIVSSPMWM